MSDFYIEDNDKTIDVEALISHIDLIDYVSQYLDLEEKRGEFWTQCIFHDGDETASLSFNRDKQVWFCLGCKRKGNVFTFCKMYHHVSSSEAIEMLSKYANVDVKDMVAPPDTLRLMRKMKKTLGKKQIDVNHKVLNKEIMLTYEKRPIKEWLAEGISQEVLDKYQVRYDDLDSAIAFPIFDNDGNIINIKKRTLKDDFKLLKKPKYINMYKIGKLDYLYGYAFNKDKYSEYNDIIVFEGEKSVMKMESFGFYNSVALSTSTITREQANTLIKSGKNIIICMDKGITMAHILRNFEYLIKFTNCYIVIDTDGLLDDKDSPIDKGIDIFHQLYENRMKL